MAIQNKKTITVFGGTGNQGGSVVRSLLSHKDQLFHVRVITRDADGQPAQAMAALGAEVVEANGFDRGQMEKAFSGSWGVFINTNSDDEALKSLDGPSDYDLGVAVLDSAEAVGVPHVVYSSGPSISKATKGRVHLEGFETKYHVEQYGRTKKFATFTPILPASFMECFLYEPFVEAFGGFPWHPNAKTGELIFTTPPYGGKGDMPWVSVEEDFGDIIHGIFLAPEEHDRKLIQVTSQQITMPDLAASYTRATGTRCEYREMPSWQSIPLNGTRCRDETRLIFYFVMKCGGRWFAEHESDMRTSIVLKEKALQARGEKGGLTTFEKWFKKAQAARV
ncbi:hypothetical protein CFD26_102797 [Aspergillus turcosus]|uniref:NmrA-like domain-containing protein n=1 Tax=Aspergillus turcosus TaxID=1245748 RepID=A0A421D5R1_9EURO|nr:hypothetical protein CFD26_102797 [Aspergillus turcosus]